MVSVFPLGFMTKGPPGVLNNNSWLGLMGVVAQLLEGIRLGNTNSSI